MQLALGWQASGSCQRLAVLPSKMPLCCLGMHKSPWCSRLCLPTHGVTVLKLVPCTSCGWRNSLEFDDLPAVQADLCQLETHLPLLLLAGWQ